MTRSGAIGHIGREGLIPFVSKYYSESERPKVKMYQVCIPRNDSDDPERAKYVEQVSKRYRTTA